jgi:hypothetical protein
MSSLGGTEALLAYVIPSKLCGRTIWSAATIGLFHGRNLSDAAQAAEVEPSAASGGVWDSGSEKAYGPAGTVSTGSY